MSKQLRLNFIFTSFGKLFIAGSRAKGVLKLFTLNEAKVKRIKIGVIGKIIIEADENDNSIVLERTFYCSEEHIFDHSDIVVNEEYDEELIEYAVPLANNLPPSIVLKEGSIEYQIYATMEEEFADGTVQNLNTEANISVVSLVDCNTIPKATKDKVANSAHLGGCLCLQSQAPHNSLQISPRVYVPGDCITVNAVVFNAQSCPISFVQIALIQKVKLKCDERMVKVKRVVSETKHGCLMPQQVQVWHNELLRIPPLPCTTYQKHLQISYKLKLIPVKQSLQTSSVTAPLLEVPVVIGNLPLESTLAYFNPLPRCESFGNRMLPIPMPYKEYARGENCIQPTEGSKFVPAYITYTTERAMESVELQ